MEQDTGSKSEQDTIDQLNADAWLCRISDSNKALILGGEAVKLAETIGYTRGLAEGLRTMGFSYIRLSRHVEASDHLKRSLLLFESLNNLEGMSDVYEYFGIIGRSTGNYEASLNDLFKSLELRRQTGYGEGESLSLYHLGVTYKYLGNYDFALDNFLKSLSIARSNHYWIAESYSLNNLGLIHQETGSYKTAIEYFYESLAIRRERGDKWGEAGCLDNIGFCHFKTMEYESAIDFCTQGLKISESINDRKGQANSLSHLGMMYEQSLQYNNALKYYGQSLDTRRQIGDKKGEAEALIFLATLYSKEDFAEYNPERAFEMMNDALKLGNEIKANDLLSKIHFSFYEVCKKLRLTDEALAHLETYIKIEKDLHNDLISQKILHLEISHRVEKARHEAELYKLRNVELARLYEELKEQKEEMEVQKKDIEQALINLKDAQTQLIQAEKMASLGELTAGIAHEIQNPLNFVNNFSDLNKELLEEMGAELRAGNNAEALMLADDITDNEEKINHHGRRAETIVKNMLLHSRNSTGQKEPTDINALADEYLRLCYHGIRAKDKIFNATMQTEFDKNLEKINIIPQDIGRVLLNLFTNAFYSVAEKKKASLLNSEKQEYEPNVLVRTKALHPLSAGGSEALEITITDNGMGIPQKVVDKIFQPFFTTKAPGKGTGLGLSLSYDVIKAHNGELTVESKEGEFAKFVVTLPYH